MSQDERRIYGRIALQPPLKAQLGEAAVSILDLSLSGFLVAHDTRLPPGESREMRIRHQGDEMRFQCRIIRSKLVQLARRPGEKSIFHTGVKIESPLEHSDTALRELIAERVVRALEEQKANARGVPPLPEELTYQFGKSDQFRRWELVEGRWRKSETNDPKQPSNGFTVSVDFPAEYVDVLCKTFERLGPEGRQLTQVLAGLSTKKDEGGSKRYEP